MNVEVHVLQRSDAEGLSWTTLGLGPLSRARRGRSSPKLRQKLVADLKKAIGRLPPEELHWVAQRRRPKLWRLPLELTLRPAGGQRRRTGRFPVVVERWPASEAGPLLVAYHPDRQEEWFPCREEDPATLAREAGAFFSKAWRSLGDPQLERLETDGRERIRALAFDARPRTLLERLGRSRDPGGIRSGGPSRQEPGQLRVLPSLAVDETERAAEDGLQSGMPREPHRGQLRALLCQRRPTPLLLVGPPGVGKTTLLHQCIDDRLAWDGYGVHQNLDRVRHFWSTSGRRFIAGMSYLGEWEERCTHLVADLRSRGGILFVEDLHTLGRVGRSRGSDRNVAAVLQGPLSRGEIVLVGECTPEQLRFLEDDAPSFAACFTRHHVTEPSAGETLQILFHEARVIEAVGRVRFDPFAYRAILDLGGGLFPASAFPGKAVELLRDLARGASRAGESDEPVLDSTHVVAKLSERTGLPADLLKAESELPPERVTAELSRAVLGQDEAIAIARDLVLRVRARLTDPGRPYGVFLFTGPTGTGKTELAKTLARYFYGSESRLVRLDMGEYSAADAVARLIGDRWQPEGVLSRRVREEPFCVLLLDEIEKADPSVFPLLLQLFDEGRLTDASGRRLDFTHAVVVMTSNLGARSQAPAGLTSDGAAATDAGSKAAQEFFSPELYNRIDHTVRFAPLSDASARAIARKELAALLSRWGLTERGIFVQCGRTPFEKIVQDGFDPALGARTVKRYLEDAVGARLADAIAASPPAPLRVFRLFVRGGKLQLHEEALSEAPAAEARYALEPLLGASAAELRGRLPGAMDFLDALLAGEELERVSREISRRLEAGAFADAAEADAIYQLDALRRELRGLRGRIGYLLARGSPDRRELLRLLAEVEFFRRAVRRVHIEALHSVFVALGRVGLGAPGAAGAGLLAALAREYCRGRTWCEGVAARVDGEVVRAASGEPAQLDAVLAREPDLVVLKLSGLCLFDEIGPETGCHLRRSFGELEVVRVEVTRAPVDRSAEAELAERIERARRFVAALESDAGELPENPEGLLPVVRAIRQEPPAAGERPWLHVEDFQLGYAESFQTDRLSDVLSPLWLLRMSREGEE